MALNKYMHPRNIYKVPPDFGRLAKIYPEFSAISKLVRKFVISNVLKRIHIMTLGYPATY